MSNQKDQGWTSFHEEDVRSLDELRKEAPRQWKAPPITSHHYASSFHDEPGEIEQREEEDIDPNESVTLEPNELGGFIKRIKELNLKRTKKVKQTKEDIPASSSSSTVAPKSNSKVKVNALKPKKKEPTRKVLKEKKVIEEDEENEEEDEDDYGIDTASYGSSELPSSGDVYAKLERYAAIQIVKVKRAELKKKLDKTIDPEEHNNISQVLGALMNERDINKEKKGLETDLIEWFKRNSVSVHYFTEKSCVPGATLSLSLSSKKVKVDKAFTLTKILSYMHNESLLSRLPKEELARMANEMTDRIWDQQEVTTFDMLAFDFPTDGISRLLSDETFLNFARDSNVVRKKVGTKG